LHSEKTGKFLYGLLAGFLLSCVLWTLFVYGQTGNPTMSSQWVYDAYEKKRAIAANQNSDSGRILLIGGSGILFGLNSRMIENYFDKPVINYGVNAGLLLPYTLHAAKSVLRKGDLAVLCLEYPMFTYDGELNGQIISFILSREHDFLRELTIPEIIKVYSLVTFSRVMEGYRQTGKESAVSGLYGAHNIDDNGDQLNTAREQRTEDFFHEVLSHKPELYGVNFSGSTLSWEYIKDFLRWADGTGVKAIFTPVPFLKKEEYYNTDTEKYFYEHLPEYARSRGLDYIGSPYDFMYNEDAFFNTNYHLTSEYRDINTERFIRLIEEHVLY